MNPEDIQIGERYWICDDDFSPVLAVADQRCDYGYIRFTTGGKVYACATHEVFADREEASAFALQGLKKAVKGTEKAIADLKRRHAAAQNELNITTASLPRREAKLEHLKQTLGKIQSEDAT